MIKLPTYYYVMKPSSNSLPTSSCISIFVNHWFSTKTSPTQGFQGDGICTAVKRSNDV